MPVYDVLVQASLIRRTQTHAIEADTPGQAVADALSLEAEWLNAAHPDDPPESRRVIPLGCTVRGPRGLVTDGGEDE